MAQIGFQTERFISGREFIINNDHVMTIGVVLVSTTTDSGNNPTTTLRRGLTLGKITASGKYAAYSDSGSDGEAVCRGILMEDLDMLDDTGTAADKQANMLIHGYVDYSQLIGIDSNGLTDLVSGAKTCSIWADATS